MNPPPDRAGRAGKRLDILTRIGQISGKVIEIAPQRCAEEQNGDTDADGDAGHDQAVFNRRRAPVASGEGRQPAKRSFKSVNGPLNHHKPLPLAYRGTAIPSFYFTVIFFIRRLNRREKD
jgi:hypothetical protein